MPSDPLPCQCIMVKHMLVATEWPGAYVMHVKIKYDQSAVVFVNSVCSSYLHPDCECNVKNQVSDSPMDNNITTYHHIVQEAEPLCQIHTGFQRLHPITSTMMTRRSNQTKCMARSRLSICHYVVNCRNDAPGCSKYGGKRVL